MKKFGKKNLTQSKEKYSIANYISSDNLNPTSSFYDNQLFKKLKDSNLYPENDYHQESFDFTRKNKKRNLNGGKHEYTSQNNNQSREDEDSSASIPSQTKMKRLSELEENNLYLTLNISETSSIDEIKMAYRKLCRIHHPDKGGDANQFHKINRAYKILSNELCKKIYDTFASQAMNLLEYMISNECGQIDRSILNSSQVMDIEALGVIIQMHVNKYK